MIGSSGWVLGSFTLMGLTVKLVFRILGETVLFVSNKKMLTNNIGGSSFCEKKCRLLLHKPWQLQAVRSHLLQLAKSSPLLLSYF